MPSTRRIVAWTGPIGAAVGLSTTLGATVLSPTFSWSTNALSELGAAGATNPWLFNYGLIVSAVVGLPFTAAIWIAAANHVQRAGALTFAIHLLALAGVGVFSLPARLHGPAALTYFTFLAFTLWIHGTGTVLAGGSRRGLTAIWFGIANVVVWIGWVALGTDGIAVPEFVGALLMAGWIVMTFRSLPFVTDASDRQTAPVRMD